MRGILGNILGHPSVRNKLREAFKWGRKQRENQSRLSWWAVQAGRQIIEGHGPGEWIEDQGRVSGVTPGGLIPPPATLEQVTFRSLGSLGMSAS